MQLIYAGSSSKLFPGNEVIKRNKVKILKLHFNFAYIKYFEPCNLDYVKRMNFSESEKKYLIILT